MSAKPVAMTSCTTLSKLGKNLFMPSTVPIHTQKMNTSRRTYRYAYA